MTKRGSSSGKTELPTLLELKTFLAVARCESITRAADELWYLNPSSVAHHVKALERVYGVELFYHNRKRMQLTEQGRILKTAAEDIFAKLTELEAALAKRPQGEAKLAVGGPMLSSALMSALRAWLSKEEPSLEVGFVNFWDSKDVEAALLREELDAGILYQSPGPNANRLQGIPFKERLLVAAPADAHLGDGTTMTKEQLSQQTLVVPRTNADQNAVYAQVVKQLGSKFRSIEDVPSLSVSLRSVQSGQGVAVLPATTVRQSFGGSPFQILCITEPDAYVEVTLSYLPDKADSSCVESLVKAIHAVLETRGETGVGVRGRGRSLAPNP